MPDCNTAEQKIVVDRARHLVSTYEDMAELIGWEHIGRSDPSVDEAIHYFPAIERF